MPREPARLAPRCCKKLGYINHHIGFVYQLAEFWVGQKDIISKGILKRILLDMAAYLFRLELVDAELLATEEQRIEDRRSDLVAKVIPAQGEPFILHLEIQNANDSQMLVRMLRYLTDIQLAHPHDRVHQCLVYIGAERLTMPCGLESPQLQYRYEMIDMRDIDYHTLYDSQSPDAVVLAILSDFGNEDTQKIVVQLLSKLRLLMGHDEGRLREYLQMLEVLADNRDLGINIQEAYEMLQIDIERLPSYQKGIERGMEKGEHLKALEIARELLSLNFSVEQVMTITKLSPADIATLAK